MGTRRAESRAGVVTERTLVLCAGGSTRMGEPKGLRLVDGVPLLRVHVDRAFSAGMPVTVVLGFRAAEHIGVLPPGVLVVLNLRWASTDMATSARLGLTLSPTGPVLLTPVDTPPPTLETLRRLRAAPGDVVPSFEGHDGHPVRLTPPHPPGRLDQRLRAAPRIPVDDPACTLNLNTPAEWDGWIRDHVSDVGPRAP